MNHLKEKVWYEQISNNNNNNANNSGGVSGVIIL